MTREARSASATPDDPAGQVVADVGEDSLVAALGELCTPLGEGAIIGPGDDAAVVRAIDGRVVVSTDVLIEGRHFRTDWSAASDIGHRSAAANLADIAAMGAAPTALVVAVAIPGTTPLAWVRDLMRGIVDEARQAGADVVGGDVSSADSVVVSITALGDLQGREPVLRSGVHQGDVVAVAGRLGWAGAGLAVLSRGFRSPRALVDAFRRPEPPYSAAREASVAGVHAMMDISDGLVLDGQRMARASGVVIDIEAALLPRPEPIVSAAAAYNLDPLLWILGGGDDHGFLAAFDPHTPLPQGFHVVGVARDAEGSEPAVLVDGRVPEGPAGFEHFA